MEKGSQVARLLRRCPQQELVTPRFLAAEIGQKWCPSLRLVAPDKQIWGQQVRSSGLGILTLKQRQICVTL